MPQDYHHCPVCGLTDRVEKASVVSRLQAPTNPHRTYEEPRKVSFGCLGFTFVGAVVLVIVLRGLPKITFRFPSAV